MWDFFTHLLDPSGFPPRWYCGSWTPSLGWLHILSDLGVWSAYVAIPCVLGYFVLRKKDMPFRFIFLLFGAFILACGTTHLPANLLTCRPEDQCIGASHWVQFVLDEAARRALADYHYPADFVITHGDYRHESAPLSDEVRQRLLDDLELSDRD